MGLARQGPFSIVAGAMYPLRALWLFIRHPRLRRYVIIPIGINLVLGLTLYLGLLYLGLRSIDWLIADLSQWTVQLPPWTPHLPEWHGSLPEWVHHWVQTVAAWIPHWSGPTWHLSWPNWLTPPADWSLPSWRPTLPDWLVHIPAGLAIALIWLLRLVLTLVLLVLTGLVLLQFGVLLGAPWYGQLSEELEQMQTGQVTRIEVGLLRDIGRAVVYELKKLGLSLGLGVPLLLLNWVVGVGTAIATTAGIALAATIVCLDFLDSALERRRLRFRDKLAVIGRSLPASATFALVCLALVSLPLVNLLAIPVCVAAGTLFFCDRIYPWLEAEATRLPPPSRSTDIQ